MPSEGAHPNQPRPQARDHAATQHGTTNFISFLFCFYIYLFLKVQNMKI